MGSRSPARELTGQVTKINAAGTSLRLDPPGDWFRISRYAEPEVTQLREGTFVTLGLDKDDFVRTATLSAPLGDENGPSNRNLTGPTVEVTQMSAERRDRHILRSTALKCAIEWAGQQIEDYEPEELLGLAETFLSWLAEDGTVRTARRQERG